MPQPRLLHDRTLAALKTLKTKKLIKSRHQRTIKLQQHHRNIKVRAQLDNRYESFEQRHLLTISRIKK